MRSLITVQRPSASTPVSMGFGGWLLVVLVAAGVAALVAGAMIWFAMGAMDDRRVEPDGPDEWPAVPRANEGRGGSATNESRDSGEPANPRDELLRRAARVMPREQAERVAKLDGGIANTIIEAWERDLQRPFAPVLDAMMQPDFAYGDALVQSIATYIDTLTPHRSSSAYASRVQGNVLEPLARRDPDNPSAWIPWLAESFTSDTTTIRLLQETVRASDGSEQVMERMLRPGEPVPAGATVREAEVPRYSFRLREKLCFSDAHPVTAADVEFTWNFVMNERILAPRSRAYYSRIGSVVAAGDRTVVFTMRETYFNAFELCAGLEVLPRHIYEPYLDPARVDEFNNSRGLLVGSGPYRLVDDWTPDQPVDLVRNDNYWGVPPALDRIRWIIIGNAVTQLAAFRNGGIDLYGSRPAEWVDLQRRSPDLFQNHHDFAYLSPTAGYLYIAWNQQRDGRPTVFADARVRRALTHAIDKKGIVRRVFLGFAVPAKGPFHPAGLQTDPDAEDLAYDLDKAKQLLDAAGLIDRDGDGIREDSQGRPFDFAVTMPSGSPDFRSMMFIVSDSLASIGVKMRHVPMEFNMMLDRIDRRDFEAMSLGWTSGLEVDVYQMFHSDQIHETGDNYMDYRSAAADKLIEAARSEMDDEKRYALWRKVEAQLIQDQPYTFLYRRQSLVLVNGRFRNVKLVSGTLNLGGYEPPFALYVPVDLQRHR